MTQIIQFKRGTAATAATDNPVLAVGEPAVETDTGIFKIGDGASTWSALPVVYTRKVVANASATNLAITNMLHVFTGTATVNWTLPVIGSTPIGSPIWVKNRGTAALTIVPTGTDRIFDLASLTNYTVLPGESAMFVNDGSYWATLVSILQGMDTSTPQTVLNKTIAATGNKVAGGLAALTSEFSLSNSTTETTILQATLPTGDLVVGSTYRIRVHSTVVNLLASNNYVLKVYLGGVAATAAFTWAGAVTAGAFWNEFLITVRTTGASGTFMCNGSGGGTAQGSTAVTATNTVDTTQANPILKITATFSAASASNNVKVENAIIERVM